MKEDNNIKEELQALGAERLEQLHSQRPVWSPPEGYFDQLADQVLAKAQEEATPVVSLGSRWRPILRIAAAIALVATAAWWVMRDTGSTTIEPLAEASLEDLSSEAIEGYILAHVDEFDIDLLEEVAQNEGITLDMPDAGEVEPYDLEKELNADADWLGAGDIDLF